MENLDAFTLLQNGVFNLLRPIVTGFPAKQTTNEVADHNVLKPKHKNRRKKRMNMFCKRLETNGTLA